MTQHISRAQACELQYICSKKNALFFSYFLLIYEFSTYIANDMIMPGMMSVIKSFSASENMVSTSLSAFILGGASLQVILGPLSDYIGRRPVMLFGALFFLICTIFIACSQSIETFIVGRFFQGMSLCFISVIGYAALQEIFTEIYAVRLIAMMNNMTILAPLAGPLAGALILYFFGWRAIFILIMLFAIIACIGLWLYMPETVGIEKIDQTRHEPIPLNYATVKANYLSLLRNKRFLNGCFGLAIINIPIIAWIGVAPLILMKQAHLTITGYALCQIPVFLSAILGNLAMRWQTYSMSLDSIILIGSFVLISSLLLMPLCSWQFHHSYTAILLCISLYSVGLGFINGPLNRKTLFATAVPKGTASALLSLILMTLTAIGNQVAGYVYMSNQNFYFALFCAFCGLAYLPIYILYARSTRQ